MIRGKRIQLPVLVAVLLLVAILACGLPERLSPATPIATATSEALAPPVSSPVVEPTEPLLPTATPTEAVAGLPPTPVPPTPTSPPPAGGVSLNCDGTYQRLRFTDAGAAGKTVSVDTWDGSSWVNVWNVAGGDAMIRQIEAEAGYYEFGGCQKLVIVPMRYSGSGTILELGIHVWNGAGLTMVYFDDGVHGTWRKSGDDIIFEESLYLYGEPNCCPCNRQTLQYTWDGTAFIQTGSAITPTYTGAPPTECVP